MDSWWNRAKQTDALLRLAKKGDRRSLQKADRLIKQLRTEHGVEQLTVAYCAAVALKQYVERPRYVPVFRKSTAFDLWQDSLIYGRRAAIA